MSPEARTRPTPGQTVGPFFGFALPFEHGSELVSPEHPDAVRLHGTVHDGDGAPVPDALLEIWQVGPEGEVVTGTPLERRDGSFAGWGRAATDAEGRYSFTTLLPAAPYVAVCLLARGLLDRLFTRAYLPGATDAFLDGLPDERRRTLVTVADEEGLRFDVHLQGEDETVFLDFAGA